MAILEQMIIFSLLIGVGIIARRVGVVTHSNLPQFTSLVFNFAMPAIILSGITGDQPHIEGRELLMVFLAVMVTLGLLILCSIVLSRILRYEKDFHGVITVMTTFTNISMMGVPMIYSLFGPAAMIYMTVFLLPYNLMFFSYGYYCMSDQHNRENGFDWKNMYKVINPGIISCFLALILYVANIHLPNVIAQPIRMLGAVTGPVSMMLIGSFLLDMDWKTVFKDVRIWFYTLFKMIIIPVIIMLIMKQFITNHLLLGVLLAAVSTPAGAGAPLLAQALNKKAYPLALKGATFTTLAAVLTMPLVAIITGLG
ncbi:AEC family transporter [Pantoea sp. B65]|uniref:AEC family transporter n=1 Tax=Pantoea sp. B65 TaxID=2813359 RepID=UPI0039B59A0F